MQQGTNRSGGGGAQKRKPLLPWRQDEGARAGEGGKTEDGGEPGKNGRGEREEGANVEAGLVMPPSSNH